MKHKTLIIIIISVLLLSIIIGGLLYIFRNSATLLQIRYDKSLNELEVQDFLRFTSRENRFAVVNASGQTDIAPIDELESVKKINSSLICSIEKYKHNGYPAILKENLPGLEQEDKLGNDIKEIFAYSFYKKDSEKDKGVFDNYIWKKTGQFYFLSKNLSSSDFKDLKVGDTLYDAVKLDPAIYYDYRFFYSDKGAAYRVLTDGFMIINFSNETYSLGDTREFDKFKVTSIEFYEYGDERISDYFPISDIKTIKKIFDFDNIEKNLDN